ncbi:hypothetical protein CSKR_109074 [Clonorchis sinensis]|uniref:Uncharacterized protein n=1 Tax=Clonorchis sinensis TaxID=79923 RepID=A0A419PV08_CLOSI|nr:hypothetical protein CSKR_109074 [Clonorchis sinensis]
MKLVYPSIRPFYKHLLSHHGRWIRQYFANDVFSTLKKPRKIPNMRLDQTTSKKRAHDSFPVTPFRCLTATPPEGSMRAGILPSCPSLDREGREAEVGFEPRTFRSVNSRSNHWAISPHILRLR